MTITTISSREFNQNTSEAKKAASKGPVFITDRGRFGHVLLTYEEYQRITGANRIIAELLTMPEVADVELELPRSPEPARPADLS